MWNLDDVSIPDWHKEKENDHQPGSFEQGLPRMAPTFEEGIDAMQSNKASTQGQPTDPIATMILIQGAHSQVAVLVSRIPSPSNEMEQSLCLNAITNCSGRTPDSITKLESIALARSGYETTPSLTPSPPSRDGLE